MAMLFNQNLSKYDLQLIKFNQESAKKNCVFEFLIIYEKNGISNCEFGLPSLLKTFVLRENLSPVHRS